MSEPYKLIEKEFSWDDFYVLLRGDNELIRIYQKYNENYTFVREYDWSKRDVRFGEGSVEFLNGPYTDFKFLREFNKQVLYGFGIFHLYKQVFDTVELEETEEVELMDGYVEERPIVKRLDTYKLIEIELRIYQVKKF